MLDSPQSQEKIINSQLRTKKEIFHLVTLIILASFIWLWIFFSIFRQFVPESTDHTTTCYIKDVISNKLTKTHEKYVLPIGERCVRWEDLSKKEQEELSDTSGGFELFGGITTPVFLLFFALFGLFLHYLSIAFIRINAIKAGPNQFPEIWEVSKNLSFRLGMKKQPDIFILPGGGFLNAFAAKLVLRKIIVIYFELADALTEDKNQSQLEAIVGHELGHHALGHTNIFLEWFLTPVEYIPFLSLPLSRAREYSSDRAMFSLIPNLSICERALIKLITGKRLGNKVNTEAYLKQAYEEKGFFTWLAEKMSTHPHLPYRIMALQKFAEKNKLLASQGLTLQG